MTAIELVQRSSFTTTAIEQFLISPPFLGISGGDDDEAREAPFGVVVAPHFETSSAAQPIVERARAQHRRVRSVPLAV